MQQKSDPPSLLHPLCPGRRVPGRRQTSFTGLRVAALVCALFGASSTVNADDAYVLEVRTDQSESPYARFAIHTEAIAMSSGDFRLGIEYAPSSWFSLELSPGYAVPGGGLHGPALGLRAHLWPMSDGLEGLHIGIGGDVAYLQDSADGASIYTGVSAEAGYALNVGRFFLGVSSGAIMGRWYGDVTRNFKDWQLGFLLRIRTGVAFR